MMRNAVRGIVLAKDGRTSARSAGRWILLAIGLWLALQPQIAAQSPLEGGIDLPEVVSVEGHPIRTVLPPDTIRALDEPATAEAEQADFMILREKVIGVALSGEARAYPLRLLDWREVVNDRLGGRPIAVTW